MDRKLHGAGRKSELAVHPGIDHPLRDAEVRTGMPARAMPPSPKR